MCCSERKRRMFMEKNKTEIIAQIVTLLSQLVESEGDRKNEPASISATVPVEMLTIKESAALISGLSEHTVRQLVKQGKVKSVRTGEGRNGKILVNKADLITYFNGKGA